jgi:hypothetical protein
MRHWAKPRSNPAPIAGPTILLDSMLAPSAIVRNAFLRMQVWGSQLAAAVSFLETHHVRLITLDIGANDIDHCISFWPIDRKIVTPVTFADSVFALAFGGVAR